jgi:deferrochelatase/peroxidase EfeB
MPPSQDQPGPRPPSDRGPEPSPPRLRVTRREAIAGAALVGVGAGVGLDRAIESGSKTPAASAPGDLSSIQFYGERQGGITTPMQAHLHFAAFDVTGAAEREPPRRAAARLAGLLRRWRSAAAALTAGAAAPVHKR